MNNPAASSGVSVSPEGIILFAVSGGEFDPERLNVFRRKYYYETVNKISDILLWTRHLNTGASLWLLRFEAIRVWNKIIASLRCLIWYRFGNSEIIPYIFI